MITLEFTQDTSNVATVRDHIRACDEAFAPRLSERVDIAAYAEKIGAKARRFEAWFNGELVGLVAAYCNAPDRQTAFVTSVSVLPHSQGRGIASLLMQRCVSEARALGFRRLELEVGFDNDSAIALYRKQGFVIASKADGVSIMALEL